MMAGYPPKLFAIVILYLIAQTSLTTLASGIGLVVEGLVPASLPPATTRDPVPQGTGFFCAQRSAKQQNLFIYSLVAH